MKRTTLITLAAAILAGAPLAAQDSARAAHRMPRPAMEPFAGLLENREALGLTTEQVARLEAIRSGLQARNQPIRERMQAARREAGVPERSAGRRAHRTRPTPEQRQAMRRLRERIRPLAETLRANRRAARDSAHSVLTPAQRERLEALRAAHHRRGGRPHPRRAERPRGR